jgi:hypothetical protein
MIIAEVLLVGSANWMWLTEQDIPLGYMDNGIKLIQRLVKKDSIIATSTLFVFTCISSKKKKNNNPFAHSIIVATVLFSLGHSHPHSQISQFRKMLLMHQRCHVCLRTVGGSLVAFGKELKLLQKFP